MSNFLTNLLLKNHFIIGILFIIFLLFLFAIKDILVMIFISYILMSSLTPFVDFLRHRRVPKLLSVIIPYLSSIILLFVIILPLIPFFTTQVQFLIEKFPRYLDQALRILRIDGRSIDIQTLINSQLRLIGENALSVSSKIFGSLFSFLTIIILTFFLLLDHDNIKNTLINIFPEKNQKKALNIFNQVEFKLGAWLRGQLTLSLFIGIMTWIALTILRIEFALPLAVIAGVLEILPTIGPILSAIPTIIVALSISPTMAVVVIIVYIIIQVVESNVIVPFVMQQAVGFNPIIIIIAIIIGGRLMGIEGALLSLPFLSVLIILKNNILRYN